MRPTRSESRYAARLAVLVLLQVLIALVALVVLLVLRVLVVLPVLLFTGTSSTARNFLFDQVIKSDYTGGLRPCAHYN